MGMIKEFRDFAMRGNVVNMAVGVIIGGAFGKIVTSLVNDVVMPPIGMLTGNKDFSKLSVVLKEAVGEQPPVEIKLGQFFNNTLDFVIVAFVIFIVVRQMNRLSKGLWREKEKAPTTKNCTYCTTVIPIAATRCPNCTSQLAEQ